MPQDLYEQDPRVLAAVAAVRKLEQAVSASRPPNVTSRLPSDLAALGGKTPVEISGEGIAFVLSLPWDIVDGVTAAHDDILPFDVADAARFILRDWLVGHGEMAAAPVEPH